MFNSVVANYIMDEKSGVLIKDSAGSNDGTWTGTELITNGDFATWSAVATPDDVPANWTETPNAAGNDANNHTTEAIADGTPTDGGSHCKLKSDGTLVKIAQASVTVTGKTYTISIEITNAADGGVQLLQGSFTSPSLTTTGVKTFTFTAAGTTVEVKRTVGASCDITFKDVSVREHIDPQPSPSSTGLLFDGAGGEDIITVPADPSIDLNGKTQMSVSAWINPASDGEGNFGRIADKMPAGLTSGYRLFVHAEAAGFLKLQFSAQYSGATNSQAITTNAVIPINTWSHIVAVLNEDSGLKAKLYHNDTLQSLGTDIAGDGSPVDDSAVVLNIGNIVDLSRTFDGSIANVVIFNKALSKAEINVLYNGGTPIIRNFSRQDRNRRGRYNNRYRSRYR